MHAPYTIWLLLFNVAPLVLLWVFFFDELKIYWQTYLLCIVCSTIVGTAWDFLAINQRMWYWPANCCALPKVAGLPLEEPIFMVFTSALIVTVTILARDILRTHRKHVARSKR